jgi:hypothetical protein
MPIHLIPRPRPDQAAVARALRAPRGSGHLQGGGPPLRAHSPAPAKQYSEGTIDLWRVDTADDAEQPRRPEAHRKMPIAFQAPPALPHKLRSILIVPPVEFVIERGAKESSFRKCVAQVPRRATVGKKDVDCADGQIRFPRRTTRSCCTCLRQQWQWNSSARKRARTHICLGLRQACVKQQTR